MAEMNENQKKTSQARTELTSVLMDRKNLENKRPSNFDNLIDFMEAQPRKT